MLLLRVVKSIRPILSLAVGVFALVQCHPVGPPGGGRDNYQPITQVTPAPPQPSSGGGTSVAAMSRQVNLKVDMVKRGTCGRCKPKSMTPRYITIHATENYTAGAERHSQALKNGALRSGMRPGGNRIGFLIWHFTVDDHVAIQHMPTNEQGEHADFNGPGNRLSIGIEMCEHRGNSLSATIERTAKLTAVLMKKNNIPLGNVVPHYHWPRRGKNPPNKNCPHFLLENGRPGAKWRWFQGRVNYYYKQLE